MLSVVYSHHQCDCFISFYQLYRNEHKADLVTFVIDIRLDDENLGGMALGVNIPGFPAPSVPLSFLAYDVISSQRMFDQDFVPAHEWGHVMVSYLTVWHVGPSGGLLVHHLR